LASPIVATAAPEQLSKEVLETTKGLQTTQQQAVNQLQVVQDQLVAQKAETKKLSEQIAALTEKLNGVQVPAPTSNCFGCPPRVRELPGCAWLGDDRIRQLGRPPGAPDAGFVNTRVRIAFSGRI
jgi:hypothetical protein